MEFDGVKTGIAFVVLIVLATVAMLPLPMTRETIFMMVLPSMVVFGLVMLFLGVKHGEHRARR